MVLISAIDREPYSVAHPDLIDCASPLSNTSPNNRKNDYPSSRSD